MANSADMTAIEVIVRELFLQKEPDYPLDAETDLIGEGVCDSLGLVRLATAIESGFGTVVQDQDVTREKLGSISRIHRFLADQS